MLGGGVLPAGGGSPCQGGVLPARGGFSLSRGGSPCQGGFSLPEGGFSGEPPLWTEWMTDTCKNITLATTSLRPVKICLLNVSDKISSKLIVCSEKESKAKEEIETERQRQRLNKESHFALQMRKRRTYGLFTLAVSRTETGNGTRTWTNGLYGFM